MHLRQNARTFHIKRPCVLFIPKTTMENTTPQVFFPSCENKPNASGCQSTELYKCRYDRRKDKLLRRLCLNKDLALPRKVQFPSAYRQWGYLLLRQTQLQNQFERSHNGRYTQTDIFRRSHHPDNCSNHQSSYQRTERRIADAFGHS